MILFNSRIANYSWLSNFHMVDIPYENFVYPSVENFYQAMKFSPDQYHRFISISPADAKHLANTMDMIFPDTEWKIQRIHFMRIGLRIKFRETLLEWLKQTNNEELVHYAPWGDTFWGVDRAMHGENMQGRLIMEIRDMLNSTDLHSWS